MSSYANISAEVVLERAVEILKEDEKELHDIKQQLEADREEYERTHTKWWQKLLMCYEPNELLLWRKYSYEEWIEKDKNIIRIARNSVDGVVLLSDEDAKYLKLSLTHD